MKHQEKVLYMTVKLELTPEIEAGLLAQAEARGMSLEVYAAQLLQRATVPLNAPRSGKKNLVQLFAPLRGLSLDFDRNPSAARPSDL
jgi:hypothetical protein